jgi:ribosomal protein L32
VVSILNAMQNTHPFVPVRLKALKEYAGGPQYQQILGGQYQRDPLGLHEGGVRLKCACGAKVNAKLNFCPECGKPMEGAPDVEIAAAATVCGNCGGTLTPGIKFCPACGGKQESAIAATAPEGSTSAFGKFKSSASGFLKRP